MKALKTASSCLALGVVALAAACGDAGSDPVVDAGAEKPGAAPVATLRPADGPLVRADELGFFVGAEPVSGEWHAGSGVRGVVVHEARLHGRFGTGEPMLFTRDEDGAFVGMRLRRESSDRSLAPDVSAAMSAAFDPGARPDAVGSFFDVLRSGSAAPDETTPAPAEPLARAAEVRDPIHAAEAPIFSWAPDDFMAVRFRSIEAGFRFVDLADRLSERLGPAAGVRRDHQSLRLALHHLLLPSIWRANPGGPKGVSECLLLIAPEQVPGALEVAVVFRIVDHELHRMETVAGVELENSEDHLWRPLDDPFPEERVRRGARAVLGDFEVVATNNALLERILSAQESAGVGDTGSEIAERHGLPEPGRRRAFTLRGAPANPIEVDRFEAAARCARGQAAMATRFSGLHRLLLLRQAPSGGFAPSPWNDVFAACADTGIDGARVSVRMRDEPSAGALADVLREQGPDPAARRDLCVLNLGDLVPLGMTEPRASDVAERALVWSGWSPLCPDNGTYRFHPVTGTPRCTVHGVAAAPRIGPEPPLAPITEVAVEGTLVTFLLAVDWSR